MNNLILNEKKYTEDLIASATLPSGLSAIMAINYMTRYYYEQGKTLKDITDLVCEKMNSFNLQPTEYQEYKAANRIERYYNALEKGKLNLLRDYDCINLYKSEYEKIQKCDNDKEKKILFTLFILARHTDKYGWVYQSYSDIFKIANTSGTIKDRCVIIGSLIDKGFVKETKKVDDLKIGVELSDGDEEVILSVNTIDHLGNQIMAFEKDGYKLCKRCNRLIKIKGKNTQYCIKCSDEKELEKYRKYNKKR